MKLPFPPVCLLVPFFWGISVSFSGGEEVGNAVPEMPFRGVSELTFLQSGDPLIDWNSRRSWTSTEGKVVSAKILGVREGEVSLQLENGKTTVLPLARLVEADQRFIREWLAVSEYFDPGYETTRSLSNSIEAGIFDGAFAKEGKVHETRHFRFACDAVLTQDVVRDFSRLFEVTYLAIQANPLGLAIAVPDEGKFNVKLFSRDPDYLAAGGSSDAAGVYRIKDRTMLVPLSSLGLTRGNSGYKKTRDFDPRTLIHETTHALTHQWLTLAPMWFVEGFAEYISAIPYADGQFFLSRHKEGLMELASKKFGGDPRRFPLIASGEFRAMDPRSFMGDGAVEEKPIELPRVQPFQITYVSKATDSPIAPQKEAPAKSSLPTAPEDSGTSPSVEGARPQSLSSGPVVLQRYISSMALVHQLISSGQSGRLRAYLFDFARFEWDTNHYLDSYETAQREFHAAIEAQRDAFNVELRQFNSAIDHYNAEAARYNQRERSTVPVLPADPVLPKPIPVPPILSNPRSPAALSRQEFLRNAWSKHLPAEPSLSIDTL